MTEEEIQNIRLFNEMKDSVSSKFDAVNETIKNIQLAHMKSITELKVKMAVLSIVGSAIISIIVGVTIRLVHV